MAIGTPTQVGTNTSQVNTHTSIAASGCVIPAASLVVVCVGHSNGSTASGDPSAVSDGTNNYTKDASDTRTTTANCSIWSFYDTAGATRTITATIPASNVSFIYVFAISGAATSAAKDVTDNATGQGGTQASTVTTSANVAQADSVAMWALYRTTSSTWTTGYPPTNYTSLVNVVNATRGTGFATAYHKTLTAGATESAACSLPATAGWAAPLVVYKGAASGAIQQITGTINGVASVSSTVVRTRAFTPVVSGVASVSGSVVRVRTFTPTVNGVATVSASVVRTRTFTPTVNGVATVSSAVVRGRALSPSITGVATVSSTVVRTRALSPTINGVATVSVGIVRTRLLAPSTNGVATVTASVTTGSSTPASDQHLVTDISYYY